MILKAVLCFVAAIILCAGVYVFIQYVPDSYERVPYSESNVETDGPLKKAIDKKTSVFCEIESFWAKYDIWGDTDAVFTSPEKDEGAEQEVDENVGCDESVEDAVSQ